jgi:hypothetical protein
MYCTIGEEMRFSKPCVNIALKNLLFLRNRRSRASNNISFQLVT